MKTATDVASFSCTKMSPPHSPRQEELTLATDAFPGARRATGQAVGERVQGPAGSWSRVKGHCHAPLAHCGAIRLPSPGVGPGVAEGRRMVSPARTTTLIGL